jgi:hypothetical protein
MPTAALCLFEDAAVLLLCAAGSDNPNAAYRLHPVQVVFMLLM